ncbi:MAG: hypothetical protein MJ145_05170, partial [Clostridia bacterium]|nr:hypothetical protein [Clostridia bacterium]
GTLFGEEVHLEDKCKDIKAFPMKPNKYIKTFHNGDLMYYYMDDGKYAVKWVYAMDKIRESLK